MASASRLRQKSPAEFFSENQNIAGFDNPGKSLYTTIRELVENSLDAAEAIDKLPDVTVGLHRMTADDFAAMRGIGPSNKKQRPNEAPSAAVADDDELLLQSQSSQGDDLPLMSQLSALTPSQTASSQSTARGQKRKKGDGKQVVADEYFCVDVADNGMGMQHDDIPRMLGIVLSSTKYGIKQSRGKFGLGAKMALVWSKKSTAMPIEVWSSADADGSISYCKLDIDIYANRPAVLDHRRLPNPQRWRGTRIRVTIGGSWRYYSARIITYLRQLAVITPYAQFLLHFRRGAPPPSATVAASGDFAFGTPPPPSVPSTQADFTMEFARRSDRMPEHPQDVRHHPSSVDNLAVEALIRHAPKHIKTLKQFLTGAFSSVSGPKASALIDSLPASLTAQTRISTLDKTAIHRITLKLRAGQFPRPSAKCLSPAGEYNLRLGIMKEHAPELVATYAAPPNVFEGHPFIVEAAVSLGGAKAKPGVTVHRFANRIPLLFEGGNDVVSVVANKRIKWASYKMKTATDKIGVFCSIVSTRIPFKGTSKEYIGDDKGVMHKVVKAAIQNCCNQLKTRIASRRLEKSNADRRKQLSQYIPDVSRALLRLLANINENGVGAGADGDSSQLSRDDRRAAAELMAQLESEELTEQSMAEALKKHITTVDIAMRLEHQRATGRDDVARVQCFLRALSGEELGGGEVVGVNARGFTIHFV